MLRGLRQGRPESPSLFGFVLERTLGALVESWERRNFGFQVLARKLNLATFADDLVMFATSVAEGR
eukprot:823750-Lingulodinium_polyedra.AAC.1